MSTPSKSIFNSLASGLATSICAQQRFEAAEAKAKEAQSNFDEARQITARARNAKKNLESAQKILDGARNRVADAKRPKNN